MTMISEGLLFKMFTEGKSIFFSKEIDNILNGVSERNLCGRLAIYLENLLEKYGLTGYYSDPEYNRNKDGKIKTILDDELHIIIINCDLIVHSRGEIVSQDNLFAIEMKKSNRPLAEKDDDRKRLRALTKESYDGVWSYDGITLPEHVCGYIFGIYMEIDSGARSCLFEYYKKGLKRKEWFEKF